MNKTVRRGGGGWDGQLHCLIRSEHVLGSDASPECADIKGFGKLDKLRSGGIRTPNKHRNLQTNAGRVPC